MYHLPKFPCIVAKVPLQTATKPIKFWFNTQYIFIPEPSKTMEVQFSAITIRGVTIHLVTIRFVLWYTACDTLHDTIFAIHISDILFIQELSIGEDLGDRIYDLIGYCMWCELFSRNKKIPNFYTTERSYLCCLCFYILIALMFLCTHIVLEEL